MASSVPPVFPSSFGPPTSGSLTIEVPRPADDAAFPEGSPPLSGRATPLSPPRTPVTRFLERTKSPLPKRAPTPRPTPSPYEPDIAPEMNPAVFLMAKSPLNAFLRQNPEKLFHDLQGKKHKLSKAAQAAVEHVFSMLRFDHASPLVPRVSSPGSVHYRKVEFWIPFNRALISALASLWDHLEHKDFDLETLVSATNPHYIYLYLFEIQDTWPYSPTPVFLHWLLDLHVDFRITLFGTIFQAMELEDTDSDLVFGLLSSIAPHLRFSGTEGADLPLLGEPHRIEFLNRFFKQFNGANFIAHAREAINSSKERLESARKVLQDPPFLYKTPLSEAATAKLLKKTDLLL